MSLGFGQILIITILIFIIFGAGKLPTVMADLAKGIRAFKKGMAEDDQPVHNSPPKTDEKKLPPAPTAESSQHSSPEL